MKSINGLLPIILTVTFFVTSCEKENFLTEFQGELIFETLNSDIERNCTSVFFQNSTTGYATTQEGEVFKTSNGGENWEKLSISSPAPLRTSYFPSKNIGYVFGGKSSCSPSPCEPFGSIVYKTSNGGKTWQRQSVPYEWSRLNSAHFFDEKNGIVAGLGLCIKTSDGGQTWRSFTIGRNNISKIIFPNNNIGYALDLMGGFYKTEDGGESWKDIIIEDNKMTSEFCFINDKLGYANYSNKLYKTSNGGNSWNLIDSMENSINHIHFVNEKSGIIIGKKYLSDGWGFAPPPAIHVVKQTNDGGETWTITEFEENDFNERCLYSKDNITYSLGYDKIVKLKIE